MQRRGLFVVFAECDERLHELPQLFGLGSCFVDPLLLPDLHLEHLQARADHRDGRFELMPRVGDELLLLFGCSDHGIDRAARAKQDYHIHEKDAECRCAHGKKRRHENSAHLLMAVEEDRHMPSVPVVGDEVFVPRGISEALAVSERGLKIRSRIILRYGGDVLKIRLDKLSVLGIAQDKISCGKRRFGCKASVTSRTRTLSVRRMRYFALIFTYDVQHIAKLGIHGDVICDIDDKT